MERTHVSENEVPITVEPRDQSAKPQMKPRGFWYEVDGDWRRWCWDEMKHWVEDRFLHTVILGAERMLNIGTVSELDDFADEYHVWERVISVVDGKPLVMDRGIRWNDVAQRYDGIEIAPYLWERRLGDALWYYSWDCASGVIWQPRGVVVAPIGAVPVAVAM